MASELKTWVRCVLMCAVCLHVYVIVHVYAYVYVYACMHVYMHIGIGQGWTRTVMVPTNSQPCFLLVLPPIQFTIKLINEISIITEIAIIDQVGVMEQCKLVPGHYHNYRQTRE